MIPSQILVSLLLTISFSNALTLPQFFKRNPSAPTFPTAVSHLITLNKTLPTNVPYNDVYLYIGPDRNMDLRVPSDNLWRPVTSLLCFLRNTGLEPVVGPFEFINCSIFKVRNATNYGDTKCKMLDAISWYIDLEPWAETDTQTGAGRMRHICCGDECSYAGFHF